MRIGSLFAGIGGLELGLEWAGVGETVWQVEQDPYCLKVLARHWPNAQRFTDVRDVGAHNLPPADVICGGFPCQDISDAGKRTGIDGARSGLWSEFARIVRELRPRYVVVENVRALLVRGIDRVLGDLAASGYDAEWDVLSAAAVGAPHLRQRVFLIAYPSDANSERWNRRRGALERDATDADECCVRQGQGFDNTATLHHSYGSGCARNNGGHAIEARGAAAVAEDGRAGSDPVGERLEGIVKSGTATRPVDRSRNGSDRAWWTTEPQLGRVAYGVPARVDRLRALGNAVVPHCAEVIGRRLLEIAQEPAHV